MLHFGESVVHTGVDLLGPNFFDLKLTTRLAHLLSFANIFFIFVTISAYRYLVDGRLLITVGQVYTVTLLFPSFDRSF